MNQKTKVSDMTHEQFEQLAEYLEEFTRGDPSFPVMTCINKLISHARDLRHLCAELSTGLEDDDLEEEVQRIFGNE